MASVFFYISGHGFGHAARQVEIINAFGARSPHTAIVVRTSAAPDLLERTLRVPYTPIPGAVDTGVHQIDSIRLDERATVLEADAFHRTLIAKAAAEAALLRSYDARLVVADAPPLGCAAAAAAGVPSVVCSNFTWDWIYAGYELTPALAPDLIARIQEAYRKAQAAWRLPMHGGFETFTTVVDVPLVARHRRPDRSNADVRRDLGLPIDRRLVLVSFGGFGVNDLALDRHDLDDTWAIVLVGSDAELRDAPATAHRVTYSRMRAASLAYQDIVGAADVVLSKPGYGIVSECIANETALLYTSRGRFVEYDVFVNEMPRYLRCRFISHADLFAGRWADALESLVRQPPPPERIATDGADAVARMMRDVLTSA